MGNGNSKKSRKSQVFEIVDESDNTNLEGIIPITVPDVENVPSSVTHENTVISKTEPPDPVPAETTTENENGVLAVNKTDTLNNVNEQLNDIDIDGSTPSGDGVEAEIDNTNSTANVIDTETNDKCTIPQESSETNDLKTDEEINKQDFHLESNTPEIINEPAMSNKIDEKIKVKSKEKKKSKKEKEPKMEKGSKKNEKLSRKESILSKIFSIKRKEQKDKTEVNETHSEVNYMPCHEIIDTVTVQKDTEIAADVQVVPQNVETDGKSTVDEIGVSMDTSQIYTGEKFHTTIRIIQIEYDDSSNSESKGCENVLRLESEGAVENHLVISNEPDKVHTENVTDNAKPDAVNTTIDTDKSSDAIQNYLQETFDLIDAAEIPMPSFSSQETSSTNNGCENVTLGVTTTKDEFQISSGLSPSNDLPKDAHRNDEISKSIQPTEKTEIIRTTIGTPETIETPKSIETPEKIETLEKPEVPLAEVESKNTVPSSVTHENTVISKTEPPVPAETTTKKENGVLAVNKTDTLNGVNEQLNDIDIDGSTPSGDGVEAEIDNTNSTANVIDTETNDKCTIPQESSETNDLKTDEEINKQDFHLESNTPEIINEPEISNEIDEKIKVKSKEKKKSKKEKEPKMEKGSKKKGKLSRKQSILSKIFSIKRKEQKDKTEVNETHPEVNYVPCHEIIDTVTVQKDTSQICTGEKFHNTIRIIQNDSSNSESKGCENVTRLESEGTVENHLVISNEPDKVHTENVTDNAKPDAVNTTIDTDKSSDPIQNDLQETFDLIDAAEISMPFFSSQETSSTNNGCENVTLGVTTTKDEFQISSGLSPSNDLPKDVHRNDEIPKSIQPTEKTEIIRTTIGTPETIETPKSIETPEKIETLEKPEVPLAEVESKNTVPSSVTHENTVISKTEPPVPAETTTKKENGVLAVNKTDTLNGVNEQLNDIDIDGSTPSGDGVEAEIDNTNSTANVIDTETNDKCTIPQESSETNDLKTDEEINKQDFHLESNTPEIINEPEISNEIDEKIKVKSKEKKKSKKEKEPKMEKGSKKKGKLSRKQSILSKIFSIKRKEQKDKTEVNETHPEVNYVPCHEIIDTVTVQKDTSQICTGEKFHNTIRIIQNDSSNSESKGCENVTRLESEGTVENHLVISNEPDKVHTENVTDNAKPDAVNTTIDTDKSSDPIQNDLQETFDLIDAAEISMPFFSSQETSSTNNGCENVTLGVTTTKDEFQISSGLSPSNDLPKDVHRNDEIPKSIQPTEKTEIIRTTIGTPETIETPKSIETPEKIETLEKPEVPLAEVESKNTGDAVNNLIKKFEEQNVQKKKEKIETLDNTIDYDTINSTASTSDHITSTRDSGDSKPVVNGRVDLDVNKLYENANAQTVDINTKKETDISIATTVSVEDGNVIADNTSLEKPEENVNGTQNEALNGSSENIEINPKDQSENMTIHVSCENLIQKTNTKGNEKKKKKEKEKKGKGAKEKKKTQNEKMNEPEVPLAEVELKNTGDAVHNSITKFEEQNVQKKKEKISPKKKKSKGATSNQSNTDYVAEEDKKAKKKKKKKEKKKKSSTLQNGIVISAPTLRIFQGEPVEIEVDESGMVSLSSLSSDEKEANTPTNQVKIIGIKIDSDSPTEENNLTNTSANHNLLSVDSSLATSSPKSDEYVTLSVNKDGNQSENIEVNGQLDDTVASFTQTSEASTEMAHETAQPEVDSSVEVSTVNDSNVDVVVVTVNINGELNDTSVDDAGDKNILPISPENGIAKNTISTPISDNDKTLCESPMAVENNKSKPPKKKSEKASKKKEGRPKSSLFPQSSEVSGTERNIVSRHVSFDLDPQDDTRKERPSRSFLEFLGNVFSKNSPTSESKKKNKKVTTPNKEVSTIEISQEYV